MKKIIFLATGLLTLLLACGDIIGTRMIPGDENINYYISQTTKLAMPEETAKPVYMTTYNPGDIGMPAEYANKGVPVKRYKMGLGYSETLLLNPQSDVIWPGALLDAPSIVNGGYKPITAERAPLTYSISGSIFSGKQSRTVISPSLSNMRDSIEDLLTQPITGNGAAIMSFDIKKVDSQETATIQMGAQIGDAQNFANNNYSFTDTEIKSRFLIKFLQVYYTLDIDTPSRPSDFFSNYARYDQFGYMISDNVSPVYVSSIKYGRIVLFSVESTREASEVKNALSAALTAIKAEVAIGDSDKTIIDACHIKGMILGGSTEAAADATLSGVTKLQEYITEGANVSLSSPAAPLAYTLRYLKNNEVARMVLYKEFCLPEDAVAGEPEQVEYIKKMFYMSNTNATIVYGPEKLNQNLNPEFQLMEEYNGYYIPCVPVIIIVPNVGPRPAYIIDEKKLNKMYVNIRSSASYSDGGIDSNGYQYSYGGSLGGSGVFSTISNLEITNPYNFSNTINYPGYSWSNGSDNWGDPTHSEGACVYRMEVVFKLIPIDYPL